MKAYIYRTCNGKYKIINFPPYLDQLEYLKSNAYYGRKSIKIIDKSIDGRTAVGILKESISRHAWREVDVDKELLKED